MTNKEILIGETSTSEHDNVVQNPVDDNTTFNEEISNETSENFKEIEESNSPLQDTEKNPNGSDQPEIETNDKNNSLETPDNIDNADGAEGKNETVYPYTFILSNGEKIYFIGKNGDNYISEERIDEKIFENNLSIVTIVNNDVKETFADMIFVQQMKWVDGTYYLAFRQKTQGEIFLEKFSKTSADIIDLQLAFAEMYELTLLKG